MPLWHGVTEHCLAGIQSHYPDKLDDIQAVRKSSTDQCNSSGQLFLRINEKDDSFSIPRNSDTHHQIFRERDLEWYSRSSEISLSD